MQCNEIHDPEMLVAFFRSEDEPTLSRTLRCFRHLFFSDFKGFSYNKIFSYKQYTKEKAEELAEDGFNYGLTQFYFFIRNNGFKNQGASVKSLFFTFCLNQLRALTKAKDRYNAWQISSDPNQMVENDSETVHYNYKTIQEEFLEIEREVELFRSALDELGERGSNLIMWRKVERLDNEEIAKRAGLDPGSVNNEVYRAFTKLKKIIQVLQTQN
jgi:RNA polymerase sigma factor (sigma-70 family)